jgi:aspartyl-tRNA(Asn)/glutamyl-tRNA(Gln) amidotransferase subunit B
VLVHVEHNLAVDGAERLQPVRLAALTQLEVGGQLTATQAKVVLAEIVESGGDLDPAAVALAKGFEAMDRSALDGAIDDAIHANPAVWERYVAGEDKMVGALVGAVMKATKNQADGKAVTAALRARRSS